jgi:hypothetical protein
MAGSISLHDSASRQGAAQFHQKVLFAARTAFPLMKPPMNAD